MKKTTRILGILLVAAMLLGALALSASATKPENVSGFTVQITDLIATDPSTGESKDYGIKESTFSEISMTVVNSQKIKFNYGVWLAFVDAGDQKAYDQEVTLEGYSCDSDFSASVPKSYSAGGGSWTYNFVVTKAAGHVYDNACDTECNICKATRTITHDYQGGNCTTDAVCTVCGDVKTAPGHNYAAGACTTCGEACPHTDNSPVIIDNRNGTHTEKYNCCGLEVSTTDHQLDAEGFCTTAGCGGYQSAILNGGTYEISNAGQLYWFAQHVNSGNRSANGRLTANITVNTNVLTATGDLNGDPASFRAWTPIDEFSGSFHGDGYVISGLYAKAYGVGFISYGSNVKVYNLGVMDSYFENTGYASGAIVGYMASNGTMENCFSNATIAGSSYISGGLVGEANHYAAVRNCYYFGKTVGGAFAYSGFSWYDSKSGNNYYVSTVDDGCEFTTAISADILASGELAYLLNGSVNGGAAWGQVIGTDAYPTPVAGENEKVYRTTLCNGEQGYANAETITEHDPSVTAADRFNEAGQCLVCGTQAVASVTTAGNVTTYYVDVYEAGTYAASQDNSTMTLLADVDLGEGLALFEKIKNKKNVTLDLNGKTLSSENTNTIYWDIQGHVEEHVTLTINDSVGTGKVINRKFHAVNTYSNLVINGGYFEAGIGQNTQAFAVNATSMGRVYNDTVIINGGTFHSNSGVTADSLGIFIINGGTFTGVTSVIHSGEEGQLVINGGNFPEGITARKEWTDPIAKLLAHGVFLRDENGAIITLTEKQTQVTGALTASKGANLETDGATVTANTTAYPYTNLENRPTATVVVGGQTLIEGQDYTLSWSNNVNIGTSAVVTATGIGDFSGAAFGTFEITKGTLQIAINPETTYEFGDVATDKTVTGGKVVVVGNDEMAIPGSWEWVVAGETAKFTPDAAYAELFEELTDAANVTHVITAAKPVIEVVTPSPSIMPGMSIRMSVLVKNPYNEEVTDLPTAFRITYKVGENGAPVTVEGLEFTLTSATLGDKVYVTVENVAVDGKYAVATSVNTLELLVGQVDYTKNIDEVKAALQAEIDTLKATILLLEETHGADVSELKARVAALEAAVAALDSTYATDEALAEAIAEVNGTISALAARVATLETTYASKAELQKAIEELNKAIATGDAANAAALAEAVAALEAKLAEAVKALETADAENKAALETMIAEAKAALEIAMAALEARVEKNETNIAQLQTDLQKAIEELNKAIATGDAANAAALAEAVAALEAKLAEAVKALETADAENKAALETMIAEAKIALQKAIDQVQANLNAAVEKLEQADKDNADALTAAIEELNEAIKAAKAAAEAGDAAIRGELASAKASLNAAINGVARDLAAAKSSLMSAINSGDAALSQKIEELDAALTAAIAANAAADEANKAELTALMQEADAALQAAIDKVAADLAAAQAALNTAIANGDKALDDKIAALNAALEAAIAASNAADEALTAEMNKAVETLNKAIGQVQKNLDEAKAQLVAKDEAMSAELDRLNTFVIVVCVIASTALCGCGVLVYFVFFGKRKLI